MQKSRLIQILLIIAGALVFISANLALREQKRVGVSSEISVNLPLFVQVLMAGGDRFLAANVGTFFAIVTDTAKMKPEEYKILAKTQEDVSWLNPAHEDNYYTATAILPWSGEVEATQTILRRASLARPFDYQPAFYYGFNEVYFKKDRIGAATWLREAALKLQDVNERTILENYAARWLDQSDDLGLSIAVIESMARQTQRQDFRKYLLQRVERLKNLQMLRQAANEFHVNTGESLTSLSQLVDKGIIQAVPTDPFGMGYMLDDEGIPVFNSKKK